MADPPLLSLRGIVKSFPGVLANDHVDLDLQAGQVHALLGENGAGKSTLVKVLYGFYRADAGEIRLEGQLVHIRSPQDARRLGIGMVFQEFTLIPAMNVAENVALFLPAHGITLKHQEIAQKIRETGEKYRLPIDPWAMVGELSVGEQQKVEVLKLLLADARILILDEPTKVLAPHEIKGLFDVFSKLEQDGYAIVFITHKLREVLACAHRITVMRKGRVAGALFKADASESRLVSLMFGTTLPEEVHSPAREVADAIPRLELQDVSTHGEGAGVSLSHIDLRLRAGEIVGVAGVSGNGQKELGDLILGLEKCTNGIKLLDGKEATNWSVGQIRAGGVAFIPENPLGMAMVPYLPLRENMALGNLDRYSRGAGVALDWPAVQRDADTAYRRLGLASPPLYTPVRTLSGGNTQRFVLARELSFSPKLIIALYPTRGLDVPSTNAAERLLVAAREAGAGVLLISEDLGQLLALSDRLVVLYRGKIVTECRPQETSLTEIGYAMTGANLAPLAKVPHGD